MKVRDAVERLVWTFLSGFLSALVGTPLIVQTIEALSEGSVTIEMSLWGSVALAAVIAGLVDVANALLLIARWRLSILPSPGEGIPGLPTRR